MAFSSDLAEIRFGCGLSPQLDPPGSVEVMLSGVAAPDAMAIRFPVEPFDTFRLRMVDAGDNRRDMRRTRGKPEYETYRKRRNILNRAARQSMLVWYAQTVLRWSYTPHGFRERLVRFWGDHFTARGKRGVARRATSPYLEEAIRPHVGGTFGDLLVAAVTHPVMLEYLDQKTSMGPDSVEAKKRGRRAGLNENLAREVLELHTLGVGAPYSQTDVRQLAELFAGLSFQPRKGFFFREEFAEPGPEEVLGQSYGGDPATLESIYDVLQDLARHPATARHIAQKLAVHFVADDPDPELVTAIEAAYRDSDGALMAVYGALLNHPSAWHRDLRNVKPPYDFIASSCRALAAAPEVLQGFNEKKARKYLYGPLRLMGQEWQSPAGPDGWPEEDAAWITPQGLSARMLWAMAAPAVVRPELPDPRVFATTALGPFASETVRFAAASAESKPDAIGLVLTAPAFQRR